MLASSESRRCDGRRDPGQRLRRSRPLPSPPPPTRTRKISGKAVLFMALWINTERPSDEAAQMALRPKPRPAAAGAPSQARWLMAPEMEAYLRATSYYIENPGNIHAPPEFGRGGCRASSEPQPGCLGRSLARRRCAARRNGLGRGGGRCGDRFRDPRGQALHLRTGHRTHVSDGGRRERSDGDRLFGIVGAWRQEQSSAQCEADIGPISRGVYKIGKPRKGPTPFSLPLTPDPSNEMCGRSAFLIHGDSDRGTRDSVAWLHYSCATRSGADRRKRVKQLVVVAEL